MLINPCGYPNCKDTDCENCRHNKIQEIPDEDEKPMPYDGGHVHTYEKNELLAAIKKDIELLTPSNDKIVEDLRIIYNLLTPKKPIFSPTQFEFIKTRLYKCPNCNIRIAYFKFTDKHCPNCGQALDWSKDNEQREENKRREDNDPNSPW